MPEEVDVAVQEPSVTVPGAEPGLSGEVTALSNDERLRILAGKSEIEKKKADHLDAVRVALHKHQRQQNMLNTNEELRARIKQQNNIIAQQERQLQLLRQETYLVARLKASMEKMVVKDIGLHIAHCQKRQSMHEAVTKTSNDDVELQLLQQLKMLHSFRMKMEDTTSKAGVHLEALRKQVAELEVELRGKRSAVLLDENCLRLETAASPIRHQMLSAEATRSMDATRDATIEGGIEPSWPGSTAKSVVPLDQWKHHTKETLERVMLLMERSHQLRFKMSQLTGMANRDMSSVLSMVDSAIGRKMADQRSRLDAIKLDLTNTQRIIQQLERDRKIRSAHDDAAMQSAVLRTRETLRSQRPTTEFVSDEVMAAMRQEAELFAATETDPSKALMERNLMLMTTKARGLLEKTKILGTDFLTVSRMAAVTDTIPEDYAATLQSSGAVTERGSKKSSSMSRSMKGHRLAPLVSPRQSMGPPSKASKLMHMTHVEPEPYTSSSFGFPTPVPREHKEQMLTMAYTSGLPRPPKYLGTGLDFIVDAHGATLSLDEIKTVRPKKPPMPQRYANMGKSPRVKKVKRAADEPSEQAEAALQSVAAAEGTEAPAEGTTEGAAEEESAVAAGADAEAAEAPAAEE